MSVLHSRSLVAQVLTSVLVGLIYHQLPLFSAEQSYASPDTLPFSKSFLESFADRGKELIKSSSGVGQDDFGESILEDAIKRTNSQRRRDTVPLRAMPEASVLIRIIDRHLPPGLHPNRKTPLETGQLAALNQRTK